MVLLICDFVIDIRRSFMQLGFRNSHIIQKVIKNNNDDIIAYRLENGEIIMKEEAVSMASQGLISGVTVKSDDEGNEYLGSSSEDSNDDFLINTSRNNKHFY
jgi:hypothetical protein